MKIQWFDPFEIQDILDRCHLHTVFVQKSRQCITHIIKGKIMPEGSLVKFYLAARTYTCRVSIVRTINGRPEPTKRIFRKYLKNIY